MVVKLTFKYRFIKNTRFLLFYVIVLCIINEVLVIFSALG